MAQEATTKTHKVPNGGYGWIIVFGASLTNVYVGFSKSIIHLRNILGLQSIFGLVIRPSFRRKNRKSRIRNNWSGASNEYGQPLP